MALLSRSLYRQFGPAGAAAFVAPPVMMLYTPQYVDRTTAGVQQLRQLSGELTAVTGQLATRSAGAPRRRPRSRGSEGAEPARERARLARAARASQAGHRHRWRRRVERVTRDPRPMAAGAAAVRIARRASLGQPEQPNRSVGDSSRPYAEAKAGENRWVHVAIG